VYGHWDSNQVRMRSDLKYWPPMLCETAVPNGSYCKKVPSQNSDCFKLQIRILLFEWTNSGITENNESSIYMIFKFYLQVPLPKSTMLSGLFYWVVMCHDLIFWFSLGKWTHGFFCINIYAQHVCHWVFKFLKRINRFL